MNKRLFIIPLVLLALTACQSNTTADRGEDEPLDSLDLTRLAYEHQAETRKELRNSDDVFIPAGTPVAMTGVCEMARDVPLFQIRYPDDAAHEFTGRKDYYRAHLSKHPGLAEMKEGQTYLVKGRIAGGETMCYGAYFIEVESFTTID